MSKKLNKRKYSLILLVGVLALMGVGYAYLSTTVNFNGTALINSTQWNIYLDNVQVTDGSVTPTTAATINDAKTEVTYGVTLANPGDFYEFTVDIKNDGSIDGMIESINSKLNNAAITTLPDYLDYEVTYSSGANILHKHLLKSSTKETFKVRIEFKRDVTVTQLPSTNQTLSLGFSVSYKQADENGIDVLHHLIRYTYRGLVSINQQIPEKIKQYKAPLSDGSSFYLKHIIKDDIIKESYLEFVVSEYSVTENEEMTDGTYALKGADVNAYESNKEILKTAFGESSCTDSSSSFSCSFPSSTGYSCSVSANRDGTVKYKGFGWLCEVGSNGISSCYSIAIEV